MRSPKRSPPAARAETSLLTQLVEMASRTGNGISAPDSAPLAPSDKTELAAAWASTKPVSAAATVAAGLPRRALTYPTTRLAPVNSPARTSAWTRLNAWPSIAGASAFARCPCSPRTATPAAAARPPNNTPPRLASAAG